MINIISSCTNSKKQLAVETLKKMSLKFGVIVNRVIESDNMVTKYCAMEGIEVLHLIKESRAIAVSSSKGEGLLVSSPDQEKYLTDVIHRIYEITGKSEVKGGSK